RADRPAALPAEEWRRRRDPDDEDRTRALARLALAGGVLTRAQQDPPVVLPRDARGDRAIGPRRARAGAEEAEPAVQEARRLGRAGSGDPRNRLQEGGGLLRRARLRKGARRPDRQQGPQPAEDGGGRAGRGGSRRRARKPPPHSPGGA